MIFDEWLKGEMDKLVKIQDELKMKYGSVDNEILKLLFEDAKEPWGFQNKERQSEKKDGRKDVLMDIVSKYDLEVNEGIIKIPRKVDDFKSLCKELEAHNYVYVKGKSVFVPKWNGVQR